VVSSGPRSRLPKDIPVIDSTSAVPGHLLELTADFSLSASHDILRLYDLNDTRAFKHSTVPFLIIPGPPRAGVISSLYIDPTSRFMLSAAGNRGWEGTNTEALIGYEINVLNN
jgi:hypothetical protein